jgi:hypothetical protein
VVQEIVRPLQLFTGADFDTEKRHARVGSVEAELSIVVARLGVGAKAWDQTGDVARVPLVDVLADQGRTWFGSSCRMRRGG